ncbi:receptor-type tyrosine-protein phosphatase mu-like, partial [Sinocyclocheilus rhinocerous]|uniref:receptor-type tyrosine-protein phosphatase mu-like n=1 Tax=Sinocyclocheilus rhinocerous TaxID=307959 RepID=UPI0007B8C6D1
MSLSVGGEEARHQRSSQSSRTPSTGEHSSRPPGNLHLTLTHARRGSGRAGETLPLEPETDRQPPPKKDAPAQSSARGQSGLHGTDTSRMDKLFACLFTAIGVLVSARAQVFKGDCDFEKPFSSCGYTQGRDDDLNWEQIDTSEKSSLDPWVPPGSAFMMVNSTGRFAGQKALLFTPQLKENDTHCVIFQYYVAGRAGGRPGHLNVYIKENNSPMGLPVWNTSGPAGRSWNQVELAISTYWPNFYQVRECVNTPHFLHIKGVEVNARQTATFLCTVNGEWRDSFNLWLQGIGGREAPMKATKPWNNQRFIGMFDVVNTTKQDSGRYRCIVHSNIGVGVSNYGELTIKQPPVPIAPPQLMAVGATYLWIQLNANSINGDGPIINREVEYRTVSGTMYDLQPVDKTSHKIGHLDPDTEYEISVLLTRPLEGGTGAPGPPLRARTKCAVPGEVPLDSIQASVYEDKILLKWREPAQTFGIITQYEISYKAVSSFDPVLDLSNQSGKVVKLGNETSHVFLGLYPGSTYSFTIRASTDKGFGPPAITQATTKIS